MAEDIRAGQRICVRIAPYPRHNGIDMKAISIAGMPDNASMIVWHARRISIRPVIDITNAAKQIQR